MYVNQNLALAVSFTSLATVTWRRPCVSLN